MVFPKRTCYGARVNGWAAGCLLLFAVIGRAEEFSLESVGVRGGISSNLTGRKFTQEEAFANWNLPWGWDLGKEWHLQSQLDLSIGWLTDGNDNAAIGTLGPALVLSRARLPVSLGGGISPTAISWYEFESRNFGSYLQFTSYLGFNWDFVAHWRLGYRFQHMSNADLAPHNRGLNMHMFALSYVF